MLYEPKNDLYAILSGVEYSIGDVEVLQRTQDQLSVIPCITFYTSDNSAILELSKEIAHQEIEVTIDFFGNSSIETGAMLSEADEALREGGYALTFSTDLPDPDGFHHISTRYKLIK